MRFSFAVVFMKTNVELLKKTGGETTDIPKKAGFFPLANMSHLLSFFIKQN